MRFVKFFNNLDDWLFKQENINYKHIQHILELLFKNMTDSERLKYDFWHLKCLHSVHKQLKITHFKNGSVKVE